jgi:hypothetical protein
VGDNAACFLPTVLKCMQSQCDKIGGFGSAYNPKYTTFFMQLIVIKGMGRGHLLARHVRQLRI